MMQAEAFDLLVVGGGINGVGIARDAAGRGLSVMLVEQDDLAEHTSSASTKLIHGGLRYLEYYEFRLVREALQERERLLTMAPHIIWPLEFVLPHSPGGRPAWMVRLGLFFYDHLAKRRLLTASHAVRFASHLAATVLRDEYLRGFTYSDCWVEDSRLVVLNAMDAAARGAKICTRTCLVKAETQDDLWHAELKDRAKGVTRIVQARAIVNAAGPWVGDVIGARLGRSDTKRVRMVKGSHIIVPRQYDGDYAFILQNPDGRIVFVIPYEGAFSLIGTTDIPFDGDPAKVEISIEETDYLCASVSRYLRREVKPADVVSSYAGVRPLYDDQAENASAVTRDYMLALEDRPGEPVLLSVFGGKITTYRRLAEHALEKLLPALGRTAGPAWTAGTKLPGGEFPATGFMELLRNVMQKYPFLPGPQARRLVRAYGTRAHMILGHAVRLEDLGEDFGGGLTEAEVSYLVAEEFAQTPKDILWRRSKLALHVPADTADRLGTWLAVQQTR